MRTDQLALTESGVVLRRKGMLALCLALSILVLGVSASAQHPTVITIDPPGSTLTIANAINPAGKITGVYRDASGYHGFLRASDGSFTTFDVPGAYSTEGFTINPAGVIAGAVLDSHFVIHGFVRALDGTLTTFDAPGATSTGFFQGTYAYNINPAGEISGQYQDASGVNHCYVRAPDGTIITFDAPGAGTGSGQGTVSPSVDGLNPAGAFNVQSIDYGNVNHSFVRAADGTFTPYDVPGRRHR